MQGDYSRFSFNPHKHYSGVRMQQGRVQLDADWNEQADILRYAMETHLKDLIGPAGGPAEDLGFEIVLDRPPEEPAQDEPGREEQDRQAGQREPERLPDFEIGAGRYYVQGVLCQNEEPVHFSRQPDFPGARLPEEASPDERYLVYLDVWQRHITAIQDPDIREVALGGLDTSTRTRTVWQVKLVAIEADEDEDEQDPDEGSDLLDEWKAFVELKRASGRMRARRVPGPAAVENQLYRVEIQQSDSRGVMFKWSRDNGSVAFPIHRIQPGAGPARWVVELDSLERDPLVLKPGDWVELADDDTALNGLSGPLARVETVDPAQRQVLVQVQEGPAPEQFSDPARHPLLRRWDQNEAKNGSLVDGALALEEDRWIGLENGVEVFFMPGGEYHPGDYWVIPARTLTGGIEWPQGKNGPQARPPHGIRHAYSLLALLGFSEEGWQVVKDFRRLFVPAPVVDSEDFMALRELRSDRAAIQKLEGVLAELAEKLEQLKHGLGREREHLFQDMRSRERLEEGEVVALDPGRLHHVVGANRDNETLVLGVVSEVFEEEDELSREKDSPSKEIEEREIRVRIITYGRARGKVLGPVHAGDMLVPSETDGCARKAGVIIRPGALIGKALETYEPGDRDDPGRIELFVLLG
jgi:hypothetical protein